MIPSDLTLVRGTRSIHYSPATDTVWRREPEGWLLLEWKGEGDQRYLRIALNWRGFVELTRP